MFENIPSSQDIKDFQRPLLLFEKGEHKIFWLGMAIADAFRTNIYLMVDGKEAILIDPGNKAFYSTLYQRIEQLGLSDLLTGAIFCHQDPDVAGSIADWISQFNKFKVITSGRTNILLPHYGISDYIFYDTGEANQHTFHFKSGNSLRFMDAHFLHFPGAIATYDTVSGFLFSGDVWASIDIDFQFVVTDFEEHKLKLNLFHLDYMSSSVATRGFARQLHSYDIKAILPQHGAIISQKDVPSAIEYLQNLRCGLDLIYPDL